MSFINHTILSGEIHNDESIVRTSIKTTDYMDITVDYGVNLQYIVDKINALRKDEKYKLCTKFRIIDKHNNEIMWITNNEGAFKDLGII